MSSETAAQIVRKMRRRKQFSSADRLLRAALAKEPESLKLLTQQAELAWDRKEFVECERLARRMLEIDPDFAPAHQSLGTVLLEKGDWEAGCQEERRTLELRPDEEYRAFAHSALSQCEIQNEGSTAEERRVQRVRANDHLEKALEWPEFRDDAYMRVRHAMLLALLGRKKEANAEARMALALPTATDKTRSDLTKYGLPSSELRIVSIGPSKVYSGVMNGVVVNDGSEAISFARVVVECKDAGGRIFGTGSAYVEPDRLVPGASGSFEVFLKGPMDAKGEVSCDAKVAPPGT